MWKIFFVLILTTAIFAQKTAEWGTIDYVLASTFVMAEIADFGLTNNMINNHNMVELNPIFGKKPNMSILLGTKLVFSAGAIMLTKLFIKNSTRRLWFLIAYNLIAWTPVILNMRTLSQSGYAITLKFDL